jgi:hypothetical protein
MKFYYIYELFPAIFKQPGVDGYHHIGGGPQLLGSTLLTEQGDLDVFTIVLDGLDGTGEIVIASHENSNIIIVFITVGYHIRGQLDIGAFFIGGNAGPVGIDQASQAQFSIRYGVNAGEESLLLLVKLGLLLLSHPGVVIIDSNQLAFVYNFTAEFAEVQVCPIEVIFQGMVKIATINKYHHPLPHILPPSLYK